MSNIYDYTGLKYEESKLYKILFWYSFLISAPIFQIYVNFSFFLFPFLIYRIKKVFGYIYNPQKRHLLILLFFFGSILSTYFSLNPSYSAKDLPNYFYWTILVLLFSSHYKKIDYSVIFHGIALGVTMLIIINGLYEIFGLSLPLIRKISPNAMANLMVCFIPFSISYYLKKNKSLFAFLLISFAIYTLILNGRRAGVIIIIVMSIIYFFYSIRGISSSLKVLVAITFIYISFNNNFTNNFLLEKSPRVHDIIYRYDTVITEDRSYLTRVAMIHKGISIFEQNPNFGVGLKNFANTEVDFYDDFVGANLVIRKSSINNRSSHNSYILFLAEGGLALFIPFIFIMIYIIFRNLYYTIYHNDRISFTLFISIVSMTIHFTVISSVINVYSWLLISLAFSYNPSYNIKNRLIN